MLSCTFLMPLAAHLHTVQQQHHKLQAHTPRLPTDHRNSTQAQELLSLLIASWHDAGWRSCSLRQWLIRE